jgi:hypothetical protein
MAKKSKGMKIVVPPPKGVTPQKVDSDMAATSAAIKKTTAAIKSGNLGQMKQDEAAQTGDINRQTSDLQSQGIKIAPHPPNPGAMSENSERIVVPSATLKHHAEGFGNTPPPQEHW